MSSLQTPSLHYAIYILSVIAVVTVVFAGVAAAETTVGGTVVIDEGETVADRTIIGSTVVINGTVDGDLEIYGGDVHVTETGGVDGIVRVYGGSVRIDGAVDGNALAYGGSVTLGETGTVDRTYGGVGSSLTIDGVVGGDAILLGGTVTLQQNAFVDGSLFYTGEFVDDGGTIDGSVTPISELALVPPLALFQPLFQLLMFLLALLVGLVLLSLVPTVADAASDRLTAEPLEIIKTGLLATAVSVASILLFSVLIVGIPVAIAVVLITLTFAWFASIYVRYAVGHWLLSYTSLDNRYLSLFVGVTSIALLGLIPYMGWVFEFLVLLLGAGLLGRGVVLIRAGVHKSGATSFR